jgi:hypothetical protein
VTYGVPRKRETEKDGKRETEKDEMKGEKRACERG